MGGNSANENLNVVLSLKDLLSAPMKNAAKQITRTKEQMEKTTVSVKKMNGCFSSAKAGISRFVQTSNAKLKSMQTQLQNTEGRVRLFKETSAAAFAKVGIAAAAAGAGLFKVSEAAADLEALNSQFAQVFDGMETTAGEKLSAVAEKTGIVENRLKGSYTQIAAFAKTTGMETADAMNLSERAMVAVADSAAFYDRSIEETTESLQSFLKGNYENDAALGLSCTETTRNAAANKLYGKSFQELSEEQKQLTLLQMVEDANRLSGAVGQAARESDTWTNQLGNLKQAWQDTLAAVGSAVLPDVVQGLKTMTSTLTENKDKIKAVASQISGMVKPIFSFVIEHFDTIVSLIPGVLAGIMSCKTIGTLAPVIATVAGKVKDAGGVFKALNAAMRAHPIGLVITGISLLIAAGVTLYQKSEKFRNFVNACWSAIKTVISVVVGSVKGKIQLLINIAGVLKNAFIKAKSTIINAWNGIKSSAVGCLNKIKEKIQPLLDKIKSFVDLIKKAKQKWDDWLGGGGGGFDNVLSAVKDTVDSNALGTAYYKGGLTHINERGGEIVNLPKGTQIIPHDVSVKQGQTEKAINVYVTVQGNVIGNESFLDQMGEMFVKKLKTASANI